jgi:hypothetical protein
MFPLVIDVDERFDHSSATLVWLLHFWTCQFTCTCFAVARHC